MSGQPRTTFRKVTAHRMAELVFFSGTMDCGKSTLALQMDHNHSQRWPSGAHLHQAGPGRRVDSVQPAGPEDGRRGGCRRARLLGPGGCRADARPEGGLPDLRRAQFYSPAQVEQLARVVDELEVDVFAFGITADFRTRLFPGAQRLIELADRVQVLQVEALCWCGARATHNARTVNGVMVVEGEQVVVGDTAAGDVVGYEVLCRRHHMRRMTAASRAALVTAAALSPEALPLDVAACAVTPRRP